MNKYKTSSELKKTKEKRQKAQMRNKPISSMMSKLKSGNVNPHEAKVLQHFKKWKKEEDKKDV